MWNFIKGCPSPPKDWLKQFSRLEYNYKSSSAGAATDWRDNAVAETGGMTRDNAVAETGGMMRQPRI